jgi:hypothetical protein
VAGPNRDTDCLLRAFQSGVYAHLVVELGSPGDPATTKEFTITASSLVIVTINGRSRQCTNLENLGPPEWYVASGTCIDL